MSEKTIDCLSEDIPPKHILVTYDNDDILSTLVSLFFNEGIKRDQLCIYAKTGLTEEEIKKISTKIIDCDKNISNGNLLFIDIESYNADFVKNNFKPLEDLTKSILEKIKQRSNKHVRFCGDCVNTLFKNKHFDQCHSLEEWWNGDLFIGSKICPYHNSTFNEHPHHTHKEQIIRAHDCTIPC